MAPHLEGWAPSFPMGPCPLSSGVSAAGLGTPPHLAVVLGKLFLNKQKYVVVLQLLQLAFSH